VKRASILKIGVWLASTGLMFTTTGPARAQSPGLSGSGTSFGSMSSYNFSGVGSTLSGVSAAYVPFGSMGGFVPYTPGPGGGLGVQSGMRSSVAPMPSSGMGSLGMRPTLGLGRSQITPLAPISTRAMGGMGTGGGMGSTGGLIRRAPAGGSMGGMARPPVGGYPFRQPPSLLGPASSAPAMSM
jgi:hypothetical protein